MRLRELAAELNLSTEHTPDINITCIVSDSRAVVPGSLFVAIKGVAQDGHRFIPNAIRRGAVAVMGAEPRDIEIPYLQVADARKALARVAAAWYGFPARKLVMIGVTGTDGKTTATNLLYSILKQAGIQTGMISTVSAIIGDRQLDTGFHVTTPDALEVQAYLRQMVDAGLTHCILETTSHGLAQQRVAACDFDLALVTNITHEHLDYHGSYDSYRNAKAELFRDLSSALKQHGIHKLAVLNRDDEAYAYLDELVPVEKVTYGLDAQADVYAQDIHSDITGLRFTIVGADIHQQIESNLRGSYNVSNILGAFCLAVKGLAITPGDAAAGIYALKGIPGRMQRIDLGQAFMAMVDFAHTPNALQQSLLSARALTSGKVIAVFGSAGLRDRAKRRMMAEISAQYADITILTAEDPRTEPLQAILEEMAEGARSQGALDGQTLWCVPDRGDAIRFAIRQAGAADLVIACGKGHEKSMCFGEQEYPWDDCTAMQAALAELLGVAGPIMPKLPASE